MVPLRVMILPVSGHGVVCPEVGGADVVVRLEGTGTDEVAGEGVGVVAEGGTVWGGETGFS